MRGKRDGWLSSDWESILSVPPETHVSINCGAVVAGPYPSEESVVWVTR